MTTYNNRTRKEQQIIRKAYEFEMEAIKKLDATRNPYFDTIKAMADGDTLWEAINEAVEMAFN